jgi:HK97 family phage prohead protease
MPTRTTDVLTTVREVADEPRTIEGIAVPYGQVALDTELGAEAFAPGAFRASVAHWMERQDGARLAFRPAHRERPIGTVTFLEDTPGGVRFRAQIMDTPAGTEYLDQVRAGLNGVSVEAGLPKTLRRGKDGVVVHREARLFAIAGSVSPAYDGARIALRDVEDPVDNDQTTTTEAAPAVHDVEPVERGARERATITQLDQPAVSIVITRPEAVYAPGSGNSFLRDAFRAHQGDSEARERQSRHAAHLTDVSRQIERAGEVLSSEIPGAYPNDYLPGLLTPRILKGRPFGSFYQRVPISDARPKIFAKVTTSGTVAVQSAEGAALSATDVATTAVTATPLMYGAYTDISRQALDGGDPSTQSMILQDLVEAYAQASETVIKTAVEAGSTASGVAVTAATPYAGVAANVVNYYAVRFRAASGAFIPSALYSVLLAQADSSGRPLLPMIGQVNSDGSVSRGGILADVLGATTQLSYASTTNVCVFGVPSDFVIYESSVASFSFDQVVGPQAVRVGIWAYLVVGARQGSLKVTAA